MKKEEITTRAEIYICNFKREDGENCFNRGAGGLTDRLKAWAKQEHSGTIKVVRSGCLGKCSQGIALACYPEKKFLLNVEESDEEEIKKGLIEALKKSLV